MCILCGVGSKISRLVYATYTVVVGFLPSLCGSSFVLSIHTSKPCCVPITTFTFSFGRSYTTPISNKPIKYVNLPKYDSHIQSRWIHLSIMLTLNFIINDNHQARHRCQVYMQLLRSPFANVGVQQRWCHLGHHTNEKRVLSLNTHDTPWTPHA